jgi:tetratricopeptide (TPR) repeat protein
VISKNFKRAKCLAAARHDDAICDYLAARAIRPEMGHELAHASEAKGKRDEAIRIKHDLAAAHFTLGNALNGRAKVAEAIAAFWEAVRLKPGFAGAQVNLGVALSSHWKLAAAIAEYREAIRLKPDFADAHIGLGLLLQQQGSFREALAELKQGHGLGSKQTGWIRPLDQWVSLARPSLEISDPIGSRRSFSRGTIIRLAPNFDSERGRPFDEVHVVHGVTDPCTADLHRSEGRP